MYFSLGKEGESDGIKRWIALCEVLRYCVPFVILFCCHIAAQIISAVRPIHEAHLKGPMILTKFHNFDVRHKIFEGI